MIRRHRRAILAGVGVSGLLVFAAAVLHAVDDGDGFGLIDGEGSRTWQYIGIFLLIAADAILPIPLASRPSTALPHWPPGVRSSSRS